MWRSNSDKKNLLLMLAVSVGSLVPFVFVEAYDYYRELELSASTPAPSATPAIASPPPANAQPLPPEVREMIREIMRPSFFSRWCHWLRSFVYVSAFIGMVGVTAFSLSCLFWRPFRNTPVRLSVFIALTVVVMSIPMFLALFLAVMNYPMSF